MPGAQSAAAQQAQTFDNQSQIATRDNLNQNTENPGQFYKLLEQPIQGVSDASRKAYQDNFKQELTRYTQNFYNEPDPVKHSIERSVTRISVRFRKMSGAQLLVLSVKSMSA